MADNRVELWNQALASIGELPIQSEDDPSVKAATCKLHYLSCLKSLLERLAWPFATKQITPSVCFSEYDAAVSYNTGVSVRYEGVVYQSAVAANLGHTPSQDSVTYWVAQYPAGSGWGYVYSLPVDYVRAVGLSVGGVRISQQSIGDKPPFDIIRHPSGESRMLCCDIDPDDFPAFSYVSLVDFPPDYPQLFCDALVALLASRLALVIPKDFEKSRYQLNLMTIFISEAAASILNATQRDADPLPPSVRARL